jgi:hypothetical protein
VRLPLLASAAVCVVLAVSGIGFACGGGGSCHGEDGGTCSSGTALEWVSPSAAIPSGGAAVCSVSQSAALLTLSVSLLSPGTSCAVHGTIENAGQSPLTLSENIDANEPPGCLLFTFSDNLFGASPAPSLGPDRTFAYQGVLSLAPTAGSACENTHATFTVTIAPGQASSCEGFGSGEGSGPGGQGDCCQ